MGMTKTLKQWWRNAFPRVPQVGDRVRVPEFPSEIGTISDIATVGYGYFECTESCDVRFDNGLVKTYPGGEAFDYV